MKRISGIGAMALACVGLVAGCAGTDGKTGLDGKVSLVRIDTEAAGANCATGGTAIKVGVDANVNGLLDDAEVSASQTRFVCNGPKGSDGQEGPKSLVTATPEPKGENCQYGGFLVKTGIDDDGDNTLDASEVDSTQYICEETSIDAIHFGDINIYSPEELSKLDSIQIVIGSVYIYFDGAEALTVPDLRVVTNSLYVGDETDNDQLKHFKSMSFPELKQVNDTFELESGFTETLSAPKLEVAYYLYAEGPALKEVSFPNLAEVDELYIESSPLLTAIRLPKLARSTDEIYIDNNPLLTTLELPVLEYVDDVYIYNNELLTKVVLPKLTKVDSYLDIYDNAAMTSIELPVLAYAYELDVEGMEALTTLKLDALAETDMMYVEYTGLTALSLPALKLVTDELQIQENPALVSITAPLLEECDDLYVYDNPLLTTLSLPAAKSIDGWIGGNPELSECTIIALNYTIQTRGEGEQVGDDGGNKSETCTPETYCPFVTIGGVANRYRQCFEARSFEEARDYCKGFSGAADLAVFNDKAEYEAFVAAVPTHAVQTHSWVGYSDATTEGTFEWLGGAGYTPGVGDPLWAAGEPNDGDGSGTEDCALIIENGELNDANCDDGYTFICEVPAATP